MESVSDNASESSSYLSEYFKADMSELRDSYEENGKYPGKLNLVVTMDHLTHSVSQGIK